MHKDELAKKTRAYTGNQQTAISQYHCAQAGLSYKMLLNEVISVISYLMK